MRSRDRRPRPRSTGGAGSSALIGAGAVLTGTSAVLRHEADGWYDRYLASSDADEIPRLYDRTVHYDRLAGATLGSVRRCS